MLRVAVLLSVAMLLVSAAELNHPWPQPYGSTQNNGFSSQAGVPVKDVFVRATAVRHNVEPGLAVGVGKGMLGALFDPDAIYATYTNNIATDYVSCAVAADGQKLSEFWTSGACAGETYSTSTPVLSNTKVAYLCNTNANTNSGPRYDSLCLNELIPLPNMTETTKITPPSITFVPGTLLLSTEINSVIAAAVDPKNTAMLVSIDIDSGGPPSVRWTINTGDWTPYTIPMLVDTLVVMNVENKLTIYDAETSKIVWTTTYPGPAPVGAASSDGKAIYWGYANDLYALLLTNLTASTQAQLVTSFSDSWGNVTAPIAIPTMVGSTKATLYFIAGQKVCKLFWDFSNTVNSNHYEWIFQLNPYQNSLESDYRFIGISVSGGVAVIAGTGVVKTIALDVTNGQQSWAVYGHPNVTDTDGLYQWTGPAAFGRNGTVYYSSHSTMLTIEPVNSIDLSLIKDTFSIEANYSGVVTASWSPIPYTDWFFFENFQLKVVCEACPQEEEILVPTTSLGASGGKQYVASMVSGATQNDLMNKNGTMFFWTLRLSKSDLSSDPISGQFFLPPYHHPIPVPSKKPHHGMSKGLTAFVVIFVLALIAAVPVGYFVWKKKFSGQKEAYVAF